MILIFTPVIGRTITGDHLARGGYEFSTSIPSRGTTEFAVRKSFVPSAPAQTSTLEFSTNPPTFSSHPR
jgi:hypothetical protein